MKLTKVVICGGHLAPAVAVIEELQRVKNYQIFYIGRKRALEGDTSLSLEFLTVNKLNIPFYSIYCGRLQRSFTIYTIPSLLKFPPSLIQAVIILLKIKPQIILSFGGYVALPICIVAWILGIPIITHEQTHVLGLSNRIICRFTKVICLGWPKTKYVPQNIKTVITGNPTRKSIISISTQNRLGFGNKNLPLLYITGGSLGSQSINNVIAKIMPDLVRRFRIIHQCGTADRQADFSLLSKLKESLPDSYRENYQIIKHIDILDVGDVYCNAALIIGRSGANTVCEIAVAGKPAILIPLPWSAEDEQGYNARELEAAGSAIVIRQDLLTPENIVGAIDKIMENYSFYESKAKQARKLLIPDAAFRIVKLIEEYI